MEFNFSEWLKVSKLSKRFNFHFFGWGGNLEKNSPNLVKALQYASNIGSKIIIVGRDGGYTKKVANTCLVIPTINDKNITPHTEAFQAVIWHYWYPIQN